MSQGGNGGGMCAVSLTEMAWFAMYQPFSPLTPLLAPRLPRTKVSVVGKGSDSEVKVTGAEQMPAGGTVPPTSLKATK